MNEITFLIITGILPYLLKSLVSFFQYRRTSYYAITKKSYSSLDKDAFSEYQIYQKLKGFGKKGGKFVFNLYIPNIKDETTEIDIIFFHPKGLFVIESKNYNGWIFGSETNRN
tara:strand:+ start:472 stop:810 length:339 start_codon:yes stop_codon:yes gene_type:complete